MSKRLQSLIERARLIIEQPEPDEEYVSAYEIHVFDFDQTLQHKYKPLPCVEILREHMLAGIPVYIVTARKPDKGQEQHICDVLYWWDVNFNPENVFAIGDELEKGPVVRDLISRHEAEKCTFWDDKDYNCESVFEHCSPIVEELSVFHLSAAVPGDIRKEIIKDEDNDRKEIKHTLEERKLFRNWRRLSKI